MPRKRSPLEIKTTEAHLCSISLRLKILSQVPFFRHIAPADLEWINSHFHEKDYHTDEIICLYGDPAEKLFIIADGRVRLLRHSLSSRDILLNLLSPGEFFGALSGLGNNTYPETAQAHSSCCILFIDREAFQKVLERHPGVALMLIDLMAGRLKTANERVHQLSALSVEARLASLLLMLVNKFGEEKGGECLLQVPLTREDLAGMSGVTIETTSRVLSRFQKDGILRSGRGWVAVLDRPGLEAVAGSNVE